MINNKQPKPLANRTFGLIFAAIFLIICLLPAVFGHAIRTWALYPCAAFLTTALVYPKALAPLNTLWAKFGQIMHKIMNPILMGLIFFLTVLPTGLIMRLLSKDPMKRKLDAQANTYWIERTDKITKESFDNQF